METTPGMKRSKHSSQLSSSVVTTEEQLQAFVDYTLKQKSFSFDVETTDGNYPDTRGIPALNTVSWIGFTTKGWTITVSFDHPIGTKVIGERREPRRQSNGIKFFRMPVYEEPPPQIDRGRAFEILKPLFFSKTLIKIAHNASFDLASIAKYIGGKASEPVACSLETQHLVNENLMRYGLKWRTKAVYGFSYDDEEVGRCVEKHPYNKVAHYLVCDTVYCYMEYTRVMEEIEAQNLWTIYDLEMRLLRVLAQMRLNPIRVDTERLEEMRLELIPRVAELEAEIYRAAGMKFNLKSPAQKVRVLYLSKEEGGQGLKPWKLTKGALKKKELAEEEEDREFEPQLKDWSTDSDALETFAGNPVVDAMVEHADVFKLLSTYVVGYLGDPEDKDKPCRIFDHFIYTAFNQFGAKTGRLSSSQPNLMQVPGPDTDLGRLIRGAFMAESPDRKLVVADYGQVELVILAHYLQQGALFEGFLQGIDPHTMTAAMVLNKDPDQVTSTERKKYGKSLNFAVVYGAGPVKVASMMGASKEDAFAVLKKHQAEFPEIYEFRKYVLDMARDQKGCIETLMGRKRRVPNLFSTDKKKRFGAERQVFNSLVQGGSADLTKLAMCEYADLKTQDMRLLMTIHDELVTSAPSSMIDLASDTLRTAMTGPKLQSFIKGIPLTVELAVVDRWDQAK
jgi:DNA polymerase I-like protein with 3'-5' exonuclease and polymerase domains